MSQMRALICASLLLFVLTATVYSQTTFASITGTVTDATGAVVPNATVTASNVHTNIKTTVNSNEDGNYTVAQLKEGTYTVRAEAAGFKTFVVDNVGLVARDVRRVDVKLEVGDVASEIKVSGGVTLIETETARISDTKDSLVINSIPTNSRGLWAARTGTTCRMPSLYQWASRRLGSPRPFSKAGANSASANQSAASN